MGMLSDWDNLWTFLSEKGENSLKLNIKKAICLRLIKSTGSDYLPSPQYLT